MTLLLALLVAFSLTSQPMLSDEKHGYLLSLLIHIFYLVGYLKHSTRFAQRVYQWNGLATQLGAMPGTAIAFPLVFWYEKLFTE
ncbi:hypothetical protein PF010_g29380 [Phytophthora fragariae]|uniref:Uncharacterized protein n=1 Tax=Phytophthora fragariae TaxID=53985 RepID=A0A6G0JP12_9STRA|nr:hypothetical protein PF010_g29380 [Phytophthora fragariae]